MPDSVNSYSLYGQNLSVDQALNLPMGEARLEPAIRLKKGLPKSEEILAYLADDSDWFIGLHWGNFFFLKWQGIGTFAVREDGFEILYEIDPRTPWSVVQAYLLNQVVSTALLRQRIDALHGVACEIRGRAHLFLGDSGLGKSSLLIQFLNQGAGFISDDLLVTEQISNQAMIHKGFAHLKLYPDSLSTAKISFESSLPLSPFTEKILCGVRSDQVSSANTIPIERIYVLDDAPCAGVEIEPLCGVEKFRALASNLFNSLDHSSERKRIGLESIARWSQLPVVRLSYPRSFAVMPEVVRQVLREGM